MRYFRLLILALIALALIIVASANRAVVALNLLPAAIADFFGGGIRIELPLFIVILGAGAGGLVLGFVWEWLREHKHRATARRGKREIGRLSREMAALRGGEPPKDEVLALLEEDGRRG